MTTRHRKRLREAERNRTSGTALLELRKADLRAAFPRLVEAGRVLSAANEEKLRTAQDAITAVLASLEAPDDAAAEAGDTEAKCETCEGKGTIREGNMECPDCGGSGLAKDVKKEARRERLLRAAEAYSSSASDAADGAYIISLLLDLMSEESDEPDELPILQMAFAAITQWLQIEVAEIGTPEDLADSSGGMDLWGWEAARKRIADSGGPIARFSGGSTTKVREGKPVRGDLVAVSEAAIKEDGTGAVKIIQPGWGSSGYYAPEVLERDGPKVFTSGLKMFWDHPTLTEEFERPERSLRDLAGELTSDARWDPAGEAGPGLYANTRVFKPFAETVNELAPSIGVSIIAYAKASVGEAEGRTGQIIEELVGADSVDFVTFPGAGGQVLQLFEAARQRLGNPKPEEADMTVETDPKVTKLMVEATAERQRADRAEEALVLREAKDFVATKLAEAQIPDVTRARLAKVLALNPPAKEGKLDQPTLEKRVDEAVKGEIEYLANLTEAGKIRGMGAGGAGKEEDLTPQLEAAFKGMGLSESAAKHAAAGRQ